MTTDRHIDDYVDRVASRLRGSRRIRRHVVDEIRDHLHETHAQLEDDPRAPGADAAAITVRSLGAPEALAARLQQSVTRRHAKSATAVLFASVMTIGAVWLTLFVTGPHSPWAERHEPPGISWTEGAGFLAMKIAILTGGLAVILAWLVPRWRSAPDTAERAGRLAAGLCSVGIGSLVTSLGAIIAYVALRGTLAPRSVEWPDVAFGVGVSLLALAPLASGLRSALERALARDA